MEIISLIALMLAGGGAYILSKVFKDFQPGNKKIQADLKKMQEELDGLAIDLVPLDLEEMESASYTQEQQAAKKRFTTTARGVFTTIYHEPIIAYSYKKYVGSKTQGLIFAKTTRRQYAYLIRPKGVQIVVNKSLLGTFDENEGILRAGKKNKLIARIQKGPEGMRPIIIGEREIASLTPVRFDKGKVALSQRAFAFVKPDISAEEIPIFLSIGIYMMIKAVLEK